MSATAWIVEGDIEIEWVFKQSKDETLKNLKHRINHWQSKLAAVEAQNKAAD
jgi:hypothetical protein